MHSMAEQLKKDMCSTFADHGGLNTNTLKFFSMNLFAIEPLRSGNANITDTHHHERFHKHSKKGSQYTNNHDVADQALNKANQQLQAKDILDSIQVNKVKIYNTAVRASMNIYFDLSSLDRPNTAHLLKLQARQALETKQLVFVNNCVLDGSLRDIREDSRNEAFIQMRDCFPDLKRLAYTIKILYSKYRMGEPHDETQVCYDKKRPPKVNIY